MAFTRKQQVPSTSPTGEAPRATEEKPAEVPARAYDPGADLRALAQDVQERGLAVTPAEYEARYRAIAAKYATTSGARRFRVTKGGYFRWHGSSCFLDTNVVIDAHHYGDAGMDLIRVAGLILEPVLE